jgi:transposase-like protein
MSAQRLPDFLPRTPSCPTCKATYKRDEPMRGPVSDPNGTKDRFFVCAHCNATMKDRRASPRPTP